MEPYFCSCLNVIVNVQEVREIAGKDLISSPGNRSSSSSEENYDSYFRSNLLDVKLAISGIELAQSALSKERCYGDWIVYHCLNCGLDTHACHAIKGADRVLLPNDLQHGETLLNEIQQSTKYSKIFKLKLFADKEKSKSSISINLQQKNLLQAAEKINNIAKKIVKLEEGAMKEKIRIFTEQQNQKFLEFKKQAKRDEEAIVKAINQCETSGDSLFDSFNESYFGTTLESRDLSTDLPKIKGRSIPIRFSDSTDSDNMAQSLPIKMFSPTKGRPDLKSRNRSKSNSSNQSYRSRTLSDNDTLFELEDFNDEKNCEPFYESDDDSSGDATSLESSGGYGAPIMRGIALNPGDRVYATSVPVEIPLFENVKNSYDPDSDEVNYVQKQHYPSSHIADSIEAIAKSMQGSRSLFGDLPRAPVDRPYSYR